MVLRKAEVVTTIIKKMVSGYIGIKVVIKKKKVFSMMI